MIQVATESKGVFPSYRLKLPYKQICNSWFKMPNSFRYETGIQGTSDYDFRSAIMTTHKTPPPP